MTKQIQLGFSLVEVLIASAIIVFSVGGIVTLHTHFINQDESLKIAHQNTLLARQSLAKLQHFAMQWQDNDKLGFELIDNNQGAGLSSPFVDQKELAENQQQQLIERTWQTQPFVIIDSDADGNKDKWLASDAPQLALLPEQGVQIKHVSMQISQHATQQMQNLTALITPVSILSLSDISYFTNNKPILPVLPVERFPQAPALSFSLEPNTTLKLHASTTQFETRSKGLRSDRFVRQYLNEDHAETSAGEFVTLGCRCTLAASGQGYSPDTYDIKGSRLTRVAGQKLVKPTGLAKPKQPALCSTCCRDHHDTLQTMALQQYYRLENGLPHQHFKRLGKARFQKAAVVGDDYDEVCRFERVDGEFKIVPDLVLQDIVIYPRAFLQAADALRSYQHYIQSSLSAYIRGFDGPSQPANRQISIFSGATQTVIKGLYVEPVNTRVKQVFEQQIDNGNFEFMRSLRFWNIDLSAMAELHSDSSNTVKVYNQTPQFLFDPKINQYGQHIHALLVAAGAGKANITAEVPLGMSTIIAQPPISPKLATSQPKQSKMGVTVKESDPKHKDRAVIGNIFCLDYRQNAVSLCNLENSQQSDFVDLDLIDIRLSPEQGNCQQIQSPSSMGSWFQCGEIDASWQGTLQVSLKRPMRQWSLTLLDEFNQQLDNTVIPLGPLSEKSVIGRYAILLGVTF